MARFRMRVYKILHNTHYAAYWGRNISWRDHTAVALLIQASTALIELTREIALMNSNILTLWLHVSSQVLMSLPAGQWLSEVHLDIFQASDASLHGIRWRRKFGTFSLHQKDFLASSHVAASHASRPML